MYISPGIVVAVVVAVVVPVIMILMFIVVVFIVKQRPCRKLCTSKQSVRQFYLISYALFLHVYIYNL